MPKVIIETFIAAPPDRCFDLARSIEAHCSSSAFTSEKAVLPGKLAGLLELGDTVTFEGRHLGVKQRLTARITAFDRPNHFVDEQVRGSFAWLRHVHEFKAMGLGTVMRDTIEWKSPFGVLGRIADIAAVRPHLHAFITRKQLALKELAEGQDAV
jgi:ligand-binding SRPBCC domain-containing protein